MLEKNDMDIKIDSAMDGFEAGKKAVSFLPDLIILDLKLPGIDGFQVCKNIRNEEKLKNTKILAITGYDTPENKKKILECGADDFLAKPFEMETFINTVKKLMFNHESR